MVMVSCFTPLEQDVKYSPCLEMYTRRVGELVPPGDPSEGHSHSHDVMYVLFCENIRRIFEGLTSPGSWVVERQRHTRYTVLRTDIVE